MLPHERTHPRIRAERKRLLDTTRVQPEPILLLADSQLDLSVPGTPAEVEVDGTRLWRLPPRGAEGLGDAQLLIADGHHRYESAVELADELETDVRIMALVVLDGGRRPAALSDTPRVLESPGCREWRRRGAVCGSRRGARSPREESYDRAAAVRYRRDGVEIVHGDEGELDVELVDRYGLDGIRYTPRLDEALAVVDGGTADAAFVLRRPRVEDVFASARRGARMPPKSTYFFPKPLSGLLFHPIAG